jgi:hypothetical protein
MLACVTLCNLQHNTPCIEEIVMGASSRCSFDQGAFIVSLYILTSG